MSKTILIPLIMGLIFFGCDEPKEENSSEEHPTEVTLWGEVYSIDNTTHLDLRENNLSGLMPPEIGNLINLIQLKLEGNYLTGAIPPEIGNLTKLENLDLYDNQFSGSIPIETQITSK